MAMGPFPPAFKLLPLGDSITDGGLKTRSYRYHLHQLLQQEQHRVEWVGSMHGVYDRRRACTHIALWDSCIECWPSLERESCESCVLQSH
eukprot:6130475-Pleurochrysis_carterae.AAC.1